MKFHVFLILFVLMITVHACSNMHRTTNAKSASFEINVGQTGGFSNLNPVFKFNSNGEILKSNTGKTPFYLLKKLEQVDIDSMYYFVKNSNIRNVDIRFTGNMTHFMEYKTDSEVYRVTWVGSSQLSPEMMRLFQFLMRKLN